VRYAAATAVGAARERYRDTGGLIPADHAGHHLVDLTGALTVLDLRREEVLDALGLDDRVSTSREPDVWHLCQGLTDLAVASWGDRLAGIVYRSRTTPETSANIAFVAAAGLQGRSRELRRCTALLAELEALHGFTVDFDR